jgi:multidrug efflux system outer membrane protein
MLRARLLAAVGLTAILGACSMAPAYAPPAIAVAPAFKETGPWTPAAPEAEAHNRGDWWTVYGDATLNDLEARAAQANPSLASAAAAYDQARALATQARGGLFPSIDGSATAIRQRTFGQCSAAQWRS